MFFKKSILNKLHIKNFLKILEKNPQKKSMVLKTRIVTPKKPNSARRPVAKVFLVNKKYTVAHIPGIGHNLRKHANTLIRGGGARDLPGVSYTCIRGVYDLNSVAGRNTRRSLYGVGILENKKIKLRRKFRQK